MALTAQLGFDLTENEINEVFETTGWEISAHFAPAKDHEDIQGHIFTDDEFEKLQNHEEARDINGEAFQLDRAIGDWNCQHYAMPFRIGEQEPRHSQKELDEIKRQNQEGIEFEGEHYTLYEADQLNWRYEREIQKERRKLILNKPVKDTDLALQLDYLRNNKNIDALTKSKEKLASLLPKYNELGGKLGHTVIEKQTKKKNIIPEEYKKIFGTDSEKMNGFIAESINGITEENRKLLENVLGDEKLLKILPENSEEPNSWLNGVIQLKESVLDSFKKGGENPFLHELGHMLDEKLTSILGKYNISSGYKNKLPELHSELLKDWFALVEKHGNVDGVRSYLLSMVIENNTYKHVYKYDAITDLIGGMSGRPILGTFGHDEEYWANVFLNPHPKEAFAHLFVASNDPEKMKLMNEYFPNSVKWYNKVQKILLKEIEK